jgi:glycosyltransferase involved in cell wall biosynthesis
MARTPGKSLKNGLRWPDIAEVALCRSAVSVIQAAPRRKSRVTASTITSSMSVESLARAIGRSFAVCLIRIKADMFARAWSGFAEDAFAIAQCLPQLPIIIQDHADRPPRWWRRPQWRRWYAAVSASLHGAGARAAFHPRMGMFAPHAACSRFPNPAAASPWAAAIARAETGLHGNPCVLWVGHLSAGKDPLTVLDGAAKAMSRLPGLQLWCAFGDAPLLAEVSTRIERDPRLAGRVHLLGKVTHARRSSALMQAADLFVSGSHAEAAATHCWRRWLAAWRRWSPIFHRFAH